MPDPITILIVDDDSQLLEATEYMLGYEGYRVITAKNGEEAITKYDEIRPTLTLMDIKMPILNGYDSFLRIIKKHPDANIVFTSAYAIDDDQFKKAKKIGLRGMLIKPFDLEDLNELVLSL